MTLEDYHHHRLAYDIVTSYREKLWAYFKTLGLYTKEDEEGRIYPFSESSQTVLDCLFRPPLKVLKNLSVDSIQKYRAAITSTLFTVRLITWFVPAVLSRRLL